MQFTPEELLEFQLLCSKHLGINPTLDEARSEASKLIYLISLIQPSTTKHKNYKALKTNGKGHKL